MELRESFNESTSLKLFYHREWCERVGKILKVVLNNLSEYQLSIDVTNKCLQNQLLAQIRNPLVEQINFLSPFSSSRWKEQFSLLTKLNEVVSIQDIPLSPPFDINSIAHNRIIELSNGSEFMKKGREELNFLIINLMTSLQIEISRKFLQFF